MQARHAPTPYLANGRDTPVPPVGHPAAATTGPKLSHPRPGM